MPKREIAEFKNETGITKEMNIYSLLYMLKVKPVFHNKVNLKPVFKYLNGDREVIVTSKDDYNIMYITTGSEKNKACKVVAGEDFVEVAEVTYNRSGNGINQEGTIIANKIIEKDGKVIDASYGVKLILGEKPSLTYFGDLSDLNKANFTIKVDSKSLDGYGIEKRITETLNANHALDLFKVKHLKGSNLINGKHVDYQYTDLSILESDNAKKR